MKKFLHNTLAIFQKQVKDMLKNKMMLMTFFIHPLVAFIFEILVTSSPEVLDPNGVPSGMFALMFSIMFVGMIPTNMMSTVIAEEREKKTLRMLIYSGVRPSQYLLGLGLFSLIMSLVGGVLFGLMMNLDFAQFMLFLAVFALGSIASIVIGAALGMFAKNQVSAPAIVTPVTLVLAFMPLISQFNEGVKSFAQIFYTYQINELVVNLVPDNFTLVKFAIIFANIAVFVVLFVVAFRKVDFAE